MKINIAGAQCMWVALYFILLISACSNMNSKPQKFILVAHRGGVVDDSLSENSLKAMEEAVKRGYTHIEIDVRITKDGHVVCFHDRNLFRETGVDKNIDDLTLVEIKKIKLKRSQEYIPTFVEYCIRAEGRINLMVDIKGVDDNNLGRLIGEIDSGLSRHGLLGDALFISNRVAIYNQDKVCDWFLGRARTSWRGSIEKIRVLASLLPNPGRYHFIFNSPKDITKEMIDEFHQMGLMVIPSVNTDHYKTGDPIKQGLSDIEKMMDWGVDGLQIDSCYDPLVFSRISKE